MDPLTDIFDEGRCRVRKVSASPLTGFDPEISEWGNPPRLRGILYPKPLSIGREVGELKYLSSRRQEINRDSLSSDERNGNSPNHFGGVVGLRHLDLIYRKTLWKERPQRVIVPYLKYILFGRSILSRFGHVKSGLNLGGPPSKAKKCVRSIVN
jgi:hypothetical protein